MSRAKSTASLLIGMLAASCADPYALKVTGIDYKQRQTVGSITFTDPKLYRREELVNERREEVDYYSKKIKEIDLIAFTPEVMRELQSITTLSASLGLKFDPAQGLKFRRDEETSGIQQDITALRLQLQLDQLKRDAELMRAGLATQGAPVNPDLGNSTPAAVNTPAGAGAGTTSLDALTKSVEGLKAAIQTALSAKGEPLAAVAAATSPFDAFNDRLSYRNLLNSARNSASLDELHDKDGAALIRLNLSATVLPPAKRYLSTFGRLQMRVLKPSFGRRDKAVIRLYRDWLWRISEQLSTPAYDGTGRFSGFQQKSSDRLALSRDLFDLAFFDYSPSAPKRGAAPCPGIGFDRSTATPDGCIRVTVAVPRVELTGLTQFVPNSSYRDLYAKMLRGVTADVLAKTATALNIRGAQLAAGVGPDCALSDAVARAPIGVGGVNEMSIADGVSLAGYSLALVRAMEQAENQARVIIAKTGDTRQMHFAPPEAAILAAAAHAEEVFARLAAKQRPECTRALDEDLVGSIVPARFLRSLDDDDQRVAVYQIGPRDQVQVVSSMARAAEAISLAASIAGQIPGYGIGADGSAAYGRSVMGKADALERVPLVVAYANAQSRGAAGRPNGAVPAVFGWLMGPRVTMDAKKKELRLEQVVKPYDLSVDLSVPGWWPYVELASETAWAPDWRSEVKLAPMNERVIRVPLSPTSADLDTMTDRILGVSAIRVAEVSRVLPETISACSQKVSLQLIGSGIWRATQVVLGGRLIDGDAVSVLPDMRGLLVRLDSAEFPVVSLIGGAATVDGTVLTPYGPAPFPLRLTRVEADGSCTPKPAKATAKTVKKTVTPTIKPAAAPAVKAAPAVNVVAITPAGR